MLELSEFTKSIEESLHILENARTEIPKRIKQLEEDISKYNGERQDLLHYAENVNFNASEGYARFKELQLASQKRRKAKTELEELMVLQEKLSKRLYEGNRVVSTIATIDHIKRCRTKPVYKTRTRTDLQDRIDTSLDKKYSVHNEVSK